MSKAAELAALIGSQSSLSNRNLIINGAMQVAQRGTSSTSLGGGYHTVDRFYTAANNFDELAVSMSQSTEAPAGFSNSFRIQVTTAETALAADELFYFVQQIEGQNLQHLEYGTSSAKSITLSFWVRSSLTGTYSVLFYLDDDTRGCTHTYTINSADTWEYKTITVDGDTTGVIDNDNGHGLGLYFALSAGSSNKGTGSTSFNAYTGTDFADSNQVDFAAQTGNYYITGVQLEVGEQATPFEHRSFGDELARCQRYFQKFGDVTSNGYTGLCIGSAYATSEIRGVINFPVTMRSVPSLTTSGNFVTLPSGLSVTSIVLADDGGNPNCTVNFTVSGATTGYAYEIRANNDADAQILFDAEL